MGPLLYIIYTEWFEDTKGVFRSHTSKKNRQHNDQKKKHKRTIQKRKNTKGRSTKHIHKTKDRVTRTPLKTGGEFICSGRVGSSCSTSDTHRRVNLVTNPVTSHEREKDREVFTTSGTYPWSFVTHMGTNIRFILSTKSSKICISRIIMNS